ncbi:ABC transporter permease [Tunicatimonas pelagia]|uniref:ABC transporter permease n=1 Tax=Tunicatimonas pelagia TaxID=931531 RepID=UPI0026656AE4|nr:ABC transporter permease [Tunicatimonas pelagia]WKN44327.1 ABC transporter permease [Tunicatimonas pelagia]
MIKNTLKLVIRTLFKNKLNAAVIILSLTIGLSFATVLIAFILREANTDSFHSQRQRIYRLISDDPWESDGTITYIINPASDYLQEYYSDIEQLCRVNELNRDGITISQQNKEFSETMVVEVDTNFFSLFDFPFTQGSPTKALQKEGIILSQTLAQKLFGDQPSVGEVVYWQQDTIELALTVQGVLDEFPENSHWQFDALFPRGVSNKPFNGGVNYVLLKPRADANLLAEKVSQDDKMPFMLGEGTGTYFFQPLSDIYFDTSNERNFTAVRDATLIQVSWLIVGLILFMASFNFINLFVVSLTGRSKEFGVKKVLGASGGILRWSVVVEVLFLLGIALGLSLLVTVVLLPKFSSVFQTTLTLSYLTHYQVVGGVVVTLVALGILISVVLNRYVSRIQPVSLLKRDSATSYCFNRVLFVAQFVVSIGLIICTAVIIRQIQYIQQKPLGFNRFLIEFQAPSQELADQLPLVKQKLEQNSVIGKISLASGNPINGNAIVHQAIGEDEFYDPYLLSGDENLVETLGLKLLEGKNISANDPEGKLVNEALIRRFQLGDPIGAPLPGEPEQRIVGVVQDFNSVSLKENIPPYIISHNASPNKILLDYENQSLEETLAAARDAWSAVFPDYPFKYSLLEDVWLSRHKDDFQLYRIVVVFVVASIFITCFGLFALAWKMAQKRTKEIGIRKTLGASVFQIVRLLVWDFFKLILFAIVVASPIAYWVAQAWLENFAFRVETSWWLFALSGGLALLLAWFTMSIQTMKAAGANPVDALRYE